MRMCEGWKGMRDEKVNKCGDEKVWEMRMCRGMRTPHPSTHSH